MKAVHDKKEKKRDKTKKGEDKEIEEGEQKEKDETKKKTKGEDEEIKDSGKMRLLRRPKEVVVV